MSGVRLVARILGILGWVGAVLGLGVGLLYGQVAGALLGSPGGGTTIGLILGIVLGVAFAIGMFFYWAVLKALSEIQAQGERTLELLDDVKRRDAAAAATQRLPTT